MKSVKGAVRAANTVKNCFAPGSVLRRLLAPHKTARHFRY
jgi:hypothetical protein